MTDIKRPKSWYFLWPSLRELIKEYYTEESALPKIIDDDEIPTHYVSDHYVHLQVLSMDDAISSPVASTSTSITPDSLILNILPQQRRCAIVGDAGSGKTTLMHYISYRWSENLDWQKRYPYVFRLKLRDLTHDYGSGVLWSRGLESYLDKHIFEAFIGYGLRHLSASKKYDLPKLINMIIKRMKDKPKHDFLFLVDGYDEVAATDTKGYDVDKILTRLLEFPNYIITSRPTALSSKVSSRLDLRFSNVACKLQNMGFDEEGIRLYIRNHFRSRENGSPSMQTETAHQKFVGLWRYIEGLPMIKSVAAIPMNLMLLCILWNDEESQSAIRNTEGSLSLLYSAMFSWLSKIYINKVEENLDPEGSVEGPSLLNHPIVMFLKEVSYIMTTGDKSIAGIKSADEEETLASATLQISAEELQQYLTTLIVHNGSNNYFVAIQNRFFSANTKTKISPLEAVNKFGLFGRLKVEDKNQLLEFKHKSFQEWLCASYIVDNLPIFPSYLQTVLSRNDQGSHRMVMRFAAGLITQSTELSTDDKRSFWNVFWYYSLGGNSSVQLPNDDLICLCIIMLAEAYRASPLVSFVPVEFTAMIEDIIIHNVYRFKKALKEERYTSSPLIAYLLDAIDQSESIDESAELLSIVSHLGIPKHHRGFLFDKFRDIARLESKESLHELAVQGLYAHVYLNEAYERIVDLARSAPRNSRLLAMQYIADVNGDEAYSVMIECLGAPDEMVVAYALNCVSRMGRLDQDDISEIESLLSTFVVGPIAQEARNLCVRLELLDGIVASHVNNLQFPSMSLPQFENSLNIVSALAASRSEVCNILATILKTPVGLNDDNRLRKQEVVLRQLPLITSCMSETALENIYHALNIYFKNVKKVPLMRNSPRAGAYTCTQVLAGVSVVEKLSFNILVTSVIHGNSASLTFLFDIISSSSYETLEENEVSFGFMKFSKDDIYSALKRATTASLSSEEGHAATETSPNSPPLSPNTIFDVLFDFVGLEKRVDLLRLLLRVSLRRYLDKRELSMVINDFADKLKDLIPADRFSDFIILTKRLVDRDNNELLVRSESKSVKMQACMILLILHRHLLDHQKYDCCLTIINYWTHLHDEGPSYPLQAFQNFISNLAPVVEHQHYVACWILDQLYTVIFDPKENHEPYLQSIAKTVQDAFAAANLDMSVQHDIVRQSINCSRLPSISNGLTRSLPICWCDFLLVVFPVTTIPTECFAALLESTSLVKILPLQLLSLLLETNETSGILLALLTFYRDIIILLSSISDGKLTEMSKHDDQEAVDLQFSFLSVFLANLPIFLTHFDKFKAAESSKSQIQRIIICCMQALHSENIIHYETPTITHITAVFFLVFLVDYVSHEDLLQIISYISENYPGKIILPRIKRLLSTKVLQPLMSFSSRNWLFQLFVNYLTDDVVQDITAEVSMTKYPKFDFYAIPLKVANKFVMEMVLPSLDLASIPLDVRENFLVLLTEIYPSELTSIDKSDCVALRAILHFFRLYLGHCTSSETITDIHSIKRCLEDVIWNFLQDFLIEIQNANSLLLPEQQSDIVDQTFRVLETSIAVLKDDKSDRYLLWLKIITSLIVILSGQHSMNDTQCLKLLDHLKVLVSYTHWQEKYELIESKVLVNIPRGLIPIVIREVLILVQETVLQRKKQPTDFPSSTTTVVDKAFFLLMSTLEQCTFDSKLILTHPICREVFPSNISDNALVRVVSPWLESLRVTILHFLKSTEQPKTNSLDMLLAVTIPCSKDMIFNVVQSILELQSSVRQEIEQFLASGILQCSKTAFVSNKYERCKVVVQAFMLFTSLGDHSSVNFQAILFHIKSLVSPRSITSSLITSFRRLIPSALQATFLYWIVEVVRYSLLDFFTELKNDLSSSVSAANEEKYKAIFIRAFVDRLKISPIPLQLIATSPLLQWFPPQIRHIPRLSEVLHDIFNQSRLLMVAFVESEDFDFVEKETLHRLVSTISTTHTWKLLKLLLDDIDKLSVEERKEMVSYCIKTNLPFDGKPIPMSIDMIEAHINLLISLFHSDMIEEDVTVGKVVTLAILCYEDRIPGLYLVGHGLDRCLPKLAVVHILRFALRLMKSAVYKAVDAAASCSESEDIVPVDLRHLFDNFMDILLQQTEKVSISGDIDYSVWNPWLHFIFPVEQGFPTHAMNAIVANLLQALRDISVWIGKQRNVLIAIKESSQRKAAIVVPLWNLVVPKFVNSLSILSSTVLGMEMAQYCKIVLHILETLKENNFPVMDCEDELLQLLRLYRSATLLVYAIILALKADVVVSMTSDKYGITFTDIIGNPNHAPQLTCTLFICFSNLCKRLFLDYLPSFLSVNSGNEIDNVASMLSCIEGMTLIVIEEMTAFLSREYPSDVTKELIKVSLDHASTNLNITMLFCNHIVDDEQFVSTYTTILLGKKDDVAPPEKLQYVARVFLQSLRRAIFTTMLNTLSPLVSELVTFVFSNIPNSFIMESLLPNLCDYPYLNKKQIWSDFYALQTIIIPHVLGRILQELSKVDLNSITTLETRSFIADFIIDVSKPENLDSSSWFVNIGSLYLLWLNVVPEALFLSVMRALTGSLIRRRGDLAEFGEMLSLVDSIVPSDELLLALFKEVVSALKSFLLDTEFMPNLDLMFENSPISAEKTKQIQVRNEVFHRLVAVVLKALRSTFLSSTSQMGEMFQNAFCLLKKEKSNKSLHLFRVVLYLVVMQEQRDDENSVSLFELLKHVIIEIYLEPTDRLVQFFGPRDFSKIVPLFINSILSTASFCASTVFRSDKQKEEVIDLMIALERESPAKKTGSIVAVCLLYVLDSSELAPSAFHRYLDEFVRSFTELSPKDASSLQHFIDGIPRHLQQPFARHVLQEARKWLIEDVVRELQAAFQYDRIYQKEYINFQLLTRSYHVIRRFLFLRIGTTFLGCVHQQYRQELFRSCLAMKFTEDVTNTTLFQMRLFLSFNEEIHTEEDVKLIFSMTKHVVSHLVDNQATDKNDPITSDMEKYLESVREKRRIDEKLLKSLIHLREISDVKDASLLQLIEQIQQGMMPPMNIGMSTGHRRLTTLFCDCLDISQMMLSKESSSSSDCYRVLLKFMNDYFTFAYSWIACVESFDDQITMEDFDEDLLALRQLLPVQLREALFQKLNEFCGSVSSVSEKVVLWTLLLVCGEEMFWALDVEKQQAFAFLFRWRLQTTSDLGANSLIFEEESLISLATIFTQEIAGEDFISLKTFFTQEISAMRISEVLISCSFDKLSAEFTFACIEKNWVHLDPLVLSNLLPELWKFLHSFQVGKAAASSSSTNTENCCILKDSVDGKKVFLALHFIHVFIVRGACKCDLNRVMQEIHSSFSYYFIDDAGNRDCDSWGLILFRNLINVFTLKDFQNFANLVCSDNSQKIDLRDGNSILSAFVMMEKVTGASKFQSMVFQILNNYMLENNKSTTTLVFDVFHVMKSWFQFFPSLLSNQKGICILLLTALEYLEYFPLDIVKYLFEIPGIIEEPLYYVIFIRKLILSLNNDDTDNDEANPLLLMKMNWLATMKEQFKEMHWDEMVASIVRVSPAIKHTLMVCMTLPELLRRDAIQNFLLSQLYNIELLRELQLLMNSKSLPTTTFNELVNNDQTTTNGFSWLTSRLQRFEENTLSIELFAEKLLNAFLEKEWKSVIMFMETKFLSEDREDNEVVFKWLQYLWEDISMFEANVSLLVDLAVRKLSHSEKTTTKSPIHAGIQLLSFIYDHNSNLFFANLQKTKHINGLVAFSIAHMRNVEYDTVENFLGLKWLAEVYEKGNVSSSKPLLVGVGSVASAKASVELPETPFPPGNWTDISSRAMELLQDADQFFSKQGYSVLKLFPSMLSSFLNNIVSIAAKKTLSKDLITVSVGFQILSDLKKSTTLPVIPLIPLLEYGLSIINKNPATVIISDWTNEAMDDLLSYSWQHYQRNPRLLEPSHDKLILIITGMLKFNSSKDWSPVRFGVIFSYVWNRFETHEKEEATLLPILSDLMAIPCYVYISPDHPYGSNSVNLFWSAVFKHSRALSLRSRYRLATMCRWMLLYFFSSPAGRAIHLANEVHAFQQCLSSLLISLSAAQYLHCLGYHAAAVDTLLLHSTSSHGNMSLLWYNQVIADTTTALFAKKNVPIKEETIIVASSDGGTNFPFSPYESQAAVYPALPSRFTLQRYKLPKDYHQELYVSPSMLTFAMNGIPLSTVASLDSVQVGSQLLHYVRRQYGFGDERSKYHHANTVVRGIFFQGLPLLVNTGSWQVTFCCTVRREDQGDTSHHSPLLTPPPKFYFVAGIVLLDHVWCYSLSETELAASEIRWANKLVVIPLNKYMSMTAHEQVHLRQRLCAERTDTNWYLMYSMGACYVGASQHETLLSGLRKHSEKEPFPSSCWSPILTESTTKHVATVSFGELIGGDAELADAQRSFASLAKSSHQEPAYLLECAALKAQCTDMQAKLQEAIGHCHEALGTLHGRLDSVESATNALEKTITSNTTSVEDQPLNTLQAEVTHLQEEYARLASDRTLLLTLAGKVQLLEESVASTTVLEPADWSDYQHGVYFTFVQTLHGIGLSAQVISSQLVVMNQTGTLSKLGDLLNMVSSAVPIFGLATQITGTLLKAVDAMLQEQMLQRFAALEKGPVDMDLLFKRVAKKLLGNGSEETMLVDRRLLQESTAGMSLTQRLMSVLHQRVMDHSGLQELKLVASPTSFDAEDTAKDDAAKLAFVLTSFVYRGDLAHQLEQKQSHLNQMDAKVEILVDCALQVFGKQRHLAETYARWVVDAIQRQVQQHKVKNNAKKTLLLWHGWSESPRHLARSATFVLFLASVLMKAQWRRLFLDAPSPTHEEGRGSRGGDFSFMAAITVSTTSSTTTAAAAASIVEDEDEDTNTHRPGWISRFAQVLVTQLSESLVTTTTSSSSSSQRNHQKSRSNKRTILKRTQRDPSHMVTFDERILGSSSHNGNSSNSGSSSFSLWQWRETQDFLMQLEEALGSVGVVEDEASTNNECK